MTQSHRGNSGRKIWREWHDFRANARRDAYSKEEFSPIEQQRFNLDTAGITGEATTDRFTYDDQGRLDEGIDRRDSPIMD